MSARFRLCCPVEPPLSGEIDRQRKIEHPVSLRVNFPLVCFSQQASLSLPFEPLMAARQLMSISDRLQSWSASVAARQGEHVEVSPTLAMPSALSAAGPSNALAAAGPSTAWSYPGPPPGLPISVGGLVAHGGPAGTVPHVQPFPVGAAANNVGGPQRTRSREHGRRPNCEVCCLCTTSASHMCHVV